MRDGFQSDVGQNMRLFHNPRSAKQVLPYFLSFVEMNFSWRASGGPTYEKRPRQLASSLSSLFLARAEDRRFLCPSRRGMRRSISEVWISFFRHVD